MASRRSISRSANRIDRSTAITIKDSLTHVRSRQNARGFVLDRDLFLNDYLLVHQQHTARNAGTETGNWCSHVSARQSTRQVSISRARTGCLGALYWHWPQNLQALFIMDMSILSGESVVTRCLAVWLYDLA